MSLSGFPPFPTIPKTVQDHDQAQDVPEGVQEHHEVHEQPCRGGHEGAGLGPQVWFGGGLVRDNYGLIFK